MHWWVLIGIIVAFLAFMADLGMVEFPNKPVIPALSGGSPTILTMLLFLIVFGILGRMLQMARRREKEFLQSQVVELKERIGELEKEEKGELEERIGEKEKEEREETKKKD